MKEEELRTGRISDKELQFTNVAMASATLKRATNHGHLTNECTNFYLLVPQNKQTRAFILKVTFSKKPQKASYWVAEPIVQKRESNNEDI